MASKKEETAVAQPRETPKKSGGLNFASRAQFQLWSVGIGAVVPGVVVLGFSPWFRRWNPLITRRDVFRKVSVTSAIGGCAGYLVAMDMLSVAEEQEDESRALMRNVRDILSAADKREFMASHPPWDNIVKIEHGSHTNPPPSPSLTISQQILARCFPWLATSSSISYMRSYLEQDLLANGASPHDADIIITSLAQSLDMNDFRSAALVGTVITLYITPLGLLRERYPSAFKGAPFTVRALAFTGHALFMGVMYAATVAAASPVAAYTNLVRDKRTVAAVLRAKFHQELEAKSR